MKHVLVTGAAGIIGTATGRRLREHGVGVTGLDRPGRRPTAADRIVAGDVTKPADVEHAFADTAGLGPVDAVVHLAAIPHPRLAGPVRVFSNNVVGTFTVLAAAAAHGVRRAVVASSINANGLSFNDHRPMPAYFPIDEDLPADIADAYSLSKQVDEATVTMAGRTWGLDAICLRFPFVGTGERLAHYVGEVRRAPESAVREGWSYLDSRDAARAVLVALTALGSTVRGSHVVGLAAPDTVLDVPTADALRRWAPDVPVRQALADRASAVDTTRAGTLLSFHAVHTLGVAAQKPAREAELA